ncbi:MAG TPA: grasp-with-spasm system ATP-grasp peptide maturase [Bacteroidia bacterium]|jgi:ATP-GRASP peptide maturase of grasp-with-spasm system|nr:grasp-with-spasm system ATP-grasp peptide maturase [Bacteroidia bacterium]
MVLILTEDNEHSVDKVIDWLAYFHIPFIRLNREEPVSFECFTLGKERLSHSIMFLKGGQEIDFREIDSYWYRRGQLILEEEEGCLLNEQASLTPDIRNYLHQERSALEQAAYYWLEQHTRKALGSFSDIHLNKLRTLYEAQAVGFAVPETLITTSRKMTLDYHRTCKDSGFGIITKAIRDTPYLLMDGNLQMAYTELVGEEDIGLKASRFFPSLFQKEIKKKYDLRIFYLCGKLYGMAILSQAHYQTATDFRKYLYQRPNRQVPFELPEREQQKLVLLMNRLNLQTGSVDLILGEDNRYYFLEVNPLGQFGMLCNPCNYNLYQQIALCLSEPLTSSYGSPQQEG